ncbi:unnamed protein product, partial [marine sediment metagenome]
VFMAYRMRYLRKVRGEKMNITKEKKKEIKYETVDPYHVFDVTGSFPTKPIKHKVSKKQKKERIKSILAHW